MVETECLRGVNMITLCIYGIIYSGFINGFKTYRSKTFFNLLFANAELKTLAVFFRAN